MHRRPETHNGPVLPRYTQNHASHSENNTFLTSNLIHGPESVTVFQKLWGTAEPWLSTQMPMGP